MLGASPGEAAPWRAPVPGALAVFAIALLLMTRRPLLRVPTPLLALAAAGALQQLLARAGVATGPGIGFAPTPETLFAGIAGALAMPPPPLDVGLLLPAALSLALLATIESTTAVAALREVSGRRGDHDRDLRGAAIGMIGGGVAGGMPVGCMPLASIACWRAGGRGRAAQVWRAAVPLVLLTLAGTLVAELPFAALSGVLCGAVARLIQIPALPFAAGPGRFRRLGDLLVVLSVLVVAVAFGLVAAVGAGVLLAVLIFTASMATSPVRRTSRNPIGRSRIRRPEEEERALRRAGDAIALIELEGPIFFGSAERVLLRAEAEAAAGARVLILDLSRVTRMDLSGGRRLIEVCGVLPGRVLLAPLHPSSRAAAEIAALGLVTQIPSGAAYDDLPSAVEVAEELVFSDIAAARPAPAGTHRAALEALGMPPSVVGPLLALSKEVHFADGQLILRKGEPSDAAYLLLAGRVLISLPAGDARPATRLAVLAPGVIFGESALLGQMRRSADVVARGDVRCLRIDAAAAERLRAEAPAIAWHLMAVVAAQLAAQVRAANAIIDRLEA
jgi:MFS superfamily sulfate permease-like transporter